MQRYRVCADCGASLDPGEVCDCRSLKPVCPMYAKKGSEAGRPVIECLVAGKTWKRIYDTASDRDDTYRTCCACGKPCAVYGKACRVIRLGAAAKGVTPAWA